MLAFVIVGNFRRGLLVVLFAVATHTGLARGADTMGIGTVGGGKGVLHLELDSSEAVRGGQTGLEIFAEIERGWHINGHEPTDPFLIPTEVKFTPPPGISIDPLNYPRPDRKRFAFAKGKELLVYEGKVGITTALNVPADFVGSRARITAVMRYQACNDSTCLPPAAASAELLVPISETAAAPPAAGRPPLPAGGGASGTGFDVGAWLARRGLVLTLLAVGLLGLGLNLTPCVYPLISTTVAYFGAQARHREGRVIILATMYVFGITLSFSVLGVAAALSGGVFGAALQRPAVLLFIAAVLIALALSSFGVYQLQPPSWLMRRVSGTGRGAGGALFMGATMGVVAAPCIGPVVLGLLVFVGSQRSILLGLALFFALGLGMGLPYLLLATAAGSLKALPRSGEWLVWMERLFGVMLLALAGYFITPLLPAFASRLLLPVLIGAGGLYLGFIDRSGHHLRYFRPLQRVTGVVALIAAVWLGMPQRAESSIRWQPFSGEGVESAHDAGRPVIIDFVADWCIPCHEMDQTTFADPKVRAEAERFEMFRADITQETDDNTELTDRYRVRGVPTIIVLDDAGTEVKRLAGYTGGEELLQVMRNVH
jgi:thiol:disulfide interchange protein DsbD